MSKLVQIQCDMNWYNSQTCHDTKWKHDEIPGSLRASWAIKNGPITIESHMYKVTMMERDLMICRQS